MSNESSKPKTMMVVGHSTPDGGLVVHAAEVDLGAPVLSAVQAVSLVQKFMAMPQRVVLS